MGWAEISDSLLKRGMTTFGVEVTYYPVDDEGLGYLVKGVFDEEYVSIDGNTGIEYSSNQPNLSVRLKDLPTEPQSGDQVEIRGKRFNVANSEPDSEGGAVLILQEV